MVSLEDNVEKYGRSRKATDGSIIRNAQFACWIIKATDTHDMSYLLVSNGKDVRVNARQCYLYTYVYIVCFVILPLAFTSHMKSSYQTVVLVLFTQRLLPSDVCTVLGSCDIK
jgi:hypothetical protein